MDEYERLKIRLYQFLMARGDLLRLDAEKMIYDLKRTKQITQSQIHHTYIVLHDSEFFEQLFREIIDIL